MDINERLAKIEATLESLQAAVTALTAQKPVVTRPPLQRHVAPPVVPPRVDPPVVETPVTAVETVPAVVDTPPATVPQAAAAPIELINLLNSKEWPHAVDPTLICDISSEQDKEDRAEGILDLIIDVHLENLKFLDFGCGEGHVVNRSKSQKPKMAIGYDINKSDRWEKWEKSPNMLFTNKWDEVKGFGPFNIVLMYDVLDHMTLSYQDLVNQLKEIKKSLAVNGKVYLRAHPWCSRHGTHLYHQLNKAFAHMVFSDEELSALGYKQDKIRKVLTPIIEYNKLFAAAGLKIQNGPTQIKESVEQFFVNNHLIASRIKDNYKNCEREDLRNGKFPSDPMENQFIDYVLI